MAKQGWIVVRTQGQRELDVSLHLEADDLRTCFPRYTNRAGIPLSLFPGYIFVFARDADDYELVKRTPGVIEVLRGASADEEFYSMPGWLIWSIQSRMDELGFVDLEKDLGGSAEAVKFTPGEQLLVRAGLLAGRLVEFVKLDAAGRVAALYSAFGKTATATLDRRDVQVV